MKTGSFSRKLLLLTVISILSACSAAEQEGLASVEQVAAAEQLPDEQSSESIPEGQDDTIWPDDSFAEEGMDLTDVNVCAMIDPSDVAAITGDGITSQEEMISIEGEKGCRFQGASGNYYEIQLYPLSHWGLVDIILNEAEEIPGVGDGAYRGNYSDSAYIKVLAAGKAEISVRVSDKSLDHALALYELALQELQ
jgi:hypothetical protein